jgi:hypothetical protein
MMNPPPELGLCVVKLQTPVHAFPPEPSGRQLLLPSLRCWM